MNVTKNSINQFSIFRQRFGAGSMMKSTQEKLERQQKTQNQIEYWENRKDSLKQKKCDTVEEIAEKLEMFHSYEDEIDAAKKAYNFEQMRHVLDEAEEQGRKIAEAAEKSKPKTEEERKKEALEEAIGIENTGGILDDLLEELPEDLESLPGDLENSLEEELPGDLENSLEEELPKNPENSLEEELPKNPENSLEEELLKNLKNMPEKKLLDNLENMPEEKLPEEKLPEATEDILEQLEADLPDSRDRHLARERYENTLLTEETDKGTWLNYRM